MGRFTVNKDLLPVKGQYFLWSAGTAPIVPFLPIYARQLGFSSVVVGIIYSILPVAGMLAKPFFGAVADRLRRQKMLFILFQFITAVAFFTIQFVPAIPTADIAQFDCGAESFFKVCSEDNAGECAATQIIADSGSIGMVYCEAKCNVTDENLWTDVCESWLVPQYCPASRRRLAFTAVIPLKHTLQVKDCLYLRVERARLVDETAHVPFCTTQQSTRCLMTCDRTIDAGLVDRLAREQDVHLDCGAETNVKVCGMPEDAADGLVDKDGNNNGTIECKVDCTATDLSMLTEVCTNWNVPQYCKNSSEANNSVKSSLITKNTDLLEFVMHVPVEHTTQNGSCTSFRVNGTTFPDGTKHVPYCKNPSSNPCALKCNNAAINELIQTEAIVDSKVTQLYQFWLFFVLLLFSWIGMAVVVSMGDAICFGMLGDKPALYGNQRLWGAVGWGIFSIIAGVLVDEFSHGEVKSNYTPVFYLMLVMLTLDMVVSSRLKYTQSTMSSSIVRDVGKLLAEARIVVYLLWCIFVGLCTAMIWNFLFWHLEDLASAEGCGMYEWIKTLEGLVMGIQCFGGELPFFFLSGWIIKKIGHVNAMSLVLFAFGVRFLLYSFLVNPWWCLPIELLQGVTFGVFYATMASYASIVAPEGTEATVQGLVGAIFEGIGVSLGSLLGGVLFNSYGGSAAYRMYSIASFCMFAVHAVVQYFLQRRRQVKDFNTSARYASPNDAIHMLEDREALAPS